ncbi:hypothetical protein Trydic_g19126 [Trypoxylus dichotomus]
MQSARSLFFLMVQLFGYWLGSVVSYEGHACVLIRDCQSAWPLSWSELKSRTCGYDGRYQKIWCKVPCDTPDKERGVCIPANSCRPFVDFINTSDRSEETTDYLRKFVCQSISTEEHNYICCQNRPLNGVRPTVPPTPAPAPNRYKPYKPKPSDNYQQQCGISNTQYRVVGGSYADLGDHPWAVLLQYLSKGKMSFGCGGTLINQRYVLTAGHCIKDRNVKLVNVVLGEHNTSSPIDCFYKSCAPEPKVIRIEKIIEHPGWTDGRPQFYDDIALLRLSEDVEFSNFIQPICLPSPRSVPAWSTKLTVAGWGTADNGQGSDVKRIATMYRQDQSKCLNTVRFHLRDSQICVGGGKADSCNGDSGGPLMTSIEEQDGTQVWYLVGVVSFGYNKPCGTLNRPGIYTSVSQYLDWIQETMY